MAAALLIRQHHARRAVSWRAKALLYLGLIVGVLAMHSFITAQPVTAHEPASAHYVTTNSAHEHPAMSDHHGSTSAVTAPPVAHSANADHNGHGGHSGAEHLMHLCVAILVALVGLALALLAMHLARTRRTRRSEPSAAAAPISAAWRRLHRLRPVLPGPALLLRLGVSLT